MKQRTATELYKDAMGHLERIDHWRKGMMDKVREDSRRRVSLVRENYMVDALEQQFRDIAKNIFLDFEGTPFKVTGYVIASEGVEVYYEDEAIQDYFKVIIPWEEIQDIINAKLNVQG